MSAQESDFVAIRFGLGPARPGEDWTPDGMAAMISGLSANQRLTLPPSAERLLEGIRLSKGRREKNATDRKAAQEAYGSYTNGAYRSDVHQRILWAVNTPVPFAERLLAFWSNHFTVTRRKVQLRALVGPYEAEAILPNIGGRFADLLKAAVKHQAMLIYLDQSNSIGPNSPAGKRRKAGLNENLAREILELHTLGVHGGYTQADVTEFAKLMTGWGIDRNAGTADYRRQTAEPGRKTILGQSFGSARPEAGDFDEALDFLAAHPATARHVATRLVLHFISDNPSADSVADVEKAFIASGGNLPDVYRALGALPEARARTGAKARNDRDFLIAALRAADVPGDKLGANPRRPKSAPFTVSALATLRQVYWEATSPAGWPESADEWLSPQGLAGRLQVIPRIVRESAVESPEGLRDRALGSIVTERTARIIKAASNREEAMALVFASPEFNRR